MMIKRLTFFAVPMIVPGLRPRVAPADPARAARAVVGALVLAMCVPTSLRAQDHASHAAASPSNALVKVVREATERFKNVAVAEREGYGLLFGCVSGGDWGAMGLHFVNLPLVVDGELDPAHPEIVIYEPAPNGPLRITGADYLVFAADWDVKHPGEPPQLMGQLLHLFEAPNRFGLPAFYTLHVWAWKENPAGTFVNWHPKVSCDGFNGQ
jgi:hypothetical protein